MVCGDAEADGVISTEFQPRCRRLAVRPSFVQHLFVIYITRSRFVNQALGGLKLGRGRNHVRNRIRDLRETSRVGKSGQT